MMEHISIHSVFLHLLSTLQEEFFRPMELFAEYLKNKNFEVSDHDEVTYLLFNICFETFKQVPMLEVVLKKYPKILLKKLSNLSLRVFAGASVTHKIKKKENEVLIDGNYLRKLGDAVEFPLITGYGYRAQYVAMGMGLMYLE